MKQKYNNKPAKELIQYIQRINGAVTLDEIKSKFDNDLIQYLIKNGQITEQPNGFVSTS